MSATRRKMVVAKITSNQLGYQNSVYCHPDDFESLGIKSGDKVLIDENQVYPLRSDPKLKPNQLGCSGLICKSLHLGGKDQAVGTTVLVEPWNNRSNKIAQTVSLSYTFFCLSHTSSFKSYNV